MIDRDKPAAFGSTKDYEMRVCFAWVVAYEAREAKLRNVLPFWTVQLQGIRE